MCGIVGYIGQDKGLNKIINGLKKLEYRGYDSAGIAYVANKKIIIEKEKGRIFNLEKLLDFNTPITSGIAHTRWATHGKSNKTNAHPHQVNKFTIVHNGIIENYEVLKNELQDKGYTFKSDTDTEVACALIDATYKDNKDILKTLSNVLKIMQGSFAIGIICEDDLDSIYAIRKTSPLIVASSKKGNFLASDIQATLEYTNKYYLVDDLEIVKITKDNITFYDENLHVLKKKVQEYQGKLEIASKGNYEHFMLKEIHEENKVINKTIKAYFDGTLESLKKNFPNLKHYQKIDIVACGSAYHVGLVGKALIEEYAHIPVNCEIASEYRYKKCFYDDKTLVILVSQSGETADTLAALEKAKNDHIKTLAIVNVKTSNIARSADYVLYTEAGSEIAVATTKAYLAQIAIFVLLAIYFKNELDPNLLKDLKKLPSLIKKVIDSEDTYFALASKISNVNDAFFIGRGIDYALACEGSLKLKEISYINSSSYASGELKHGTISLITKNSLVIALSTDDYLREKTISNIKEVKARGAYLLYVTNSLPKEKFYDDIILIPKINFLLQSILTIIPLQLLSYKIAYNRGCDIDKPRNLAKSVTVE